MAHAGDGGPMGKRPMACRCRAFLAPCPAKPLTRIFPEGQNEKREEPRMRELGIERSE